MAQLGVAGPRFGPTSPGTGRRAQPRPSAAGRLCHAGAMTHELWLVRHGETEWSRDGKHTSVTDLPLTESGIEVARALTEKLDGLDFDLVLSSPRLRARRTAELAGFGDTEIDDDLVEWAYGAYEGLTTEEPRPTAPGCTGLTSSAERRGGKEFGRCPY